MDDNGTDNNQKILLGVLGAALLVALALWVIAMASGMV